MAGLQESALVGTAETQIALRGLLDDWYEQAAKLWELTAKIGQKLVEAHKRVPEEDWPAWLRAIGLNPYAAFVFMRATRYPDLMREHQPGSLEAVARLLPQGQGAAFDAEQATLARRLHEAGMSKAKLQVHMGVSPVTLRRWLDPEGYAERDERKRERRRLREGAAAAERERRRQAALKAKGGPGSLAYQHIRAAAGALDEAWRGAPAGTDLRRHYGNALDALYKAQDQVFAGEGIK